jgi:hypothetical protein
MLKSRAQATMDSMLQVYPATTHTHPPLLHYPAALHEAGVCQSCPMMRRFARARPESSVPVEPQS